DAPHDLDVAVGIDTDLDLDGADAFTHHLRHFALGFFEAQQSDRMRDRDALTHRTAEQPINWESPLPAGEIVGGEFHRGLRVGVALDDAVHARVQLADLAGHAALHGGREIARDDLDGGSGALAEVA